MLKPISFERFAKAIQKITQGRLFLQPTPEPENWGDQLFIKSGSKFFRVDYKEIMYVQSMKDYLKIHTPEHKLVTHQTMNEFERLLPARQFIRVHKSYIVAVNHIKIIYGNSIEVDGVTIPVGNSYRNNVMNLIGKKT
jgi:DNA-binding LytR/AlgR family response regulator